MVASPVGEGFWTVTVNNGSTYAIADLVVDVYVVDEAGNRTTGDCGPAKHRVNLDQVMEQLMRKLMQGGMRPITDQIGMMSGVAGFDAIYGNSMIADHITNMAMPVLRREMAAQMTDSFPSVLPAGKEAAVMYYVGGGGNLQAAIRFRDENDHEWLRPYGLPPQRHS